MNKPQNFKNWFLLLLLTSICQIAVSQQLWQGQHYSKRIILQGNIFNNQQDSVFVSIPEQGIDKIPLLLPATKKLPFNLQNERNGITIEIKSITKNKIKGNFHRYTESFPIIFESVNKIKPLYFSQHPKPPFHYTSRDIQFYGNNTDITYGATLTLPKKQKNYPLAILITGTGKQDRNYTYSGRHFFSVLADYLARNGIATLRMDDRGVGKTTGNFATATTADFADDIREALIFVRKNKNLDTSFLGLIGHSEGAMVASMVTATDRNLKFMVSLSGVGIKGIDILKLQNRHLLESTKMPSNLIELNMDLYDMLFRTVYRSSVEKLENNLDKSMKIWMQEQDSTKLKEMGFTHGGDQNFLYRYKKQADTPWYRFMIKYDPANYLSNITIPVLAVNGDKDNMVPAEENIAGFTQHVKTNLLTTKIFYGLNHMYQHCNACTPQETSQLQEVFAKEVMSFVQKWINNQYQKDK